MNNSNNNPSTTINIFIVLGVCLVVLKMIGVSPIGELSWWLVTAPLWGLVAVYLIKFILGLIVVIRKDMKEQS